MSEESSRPSSQTPPAHPHGARAAPLAVGDEPLSIEDVLAAARGDRRVTLDDRPETRERIEASRRAVSDELARGREIYGVTTGVGASVENEIPEPLRAQMPLNLLRFHGCGTGKALDELSSAAVLVVRLASLARGYSGVRRELLERLVAMLDRRIEFHGRHFPLADHFLKNINNFFFVDPVLAVFPGGRLAVFDCGLHQPQGRAPAFVAIILRRLQGSIDSVAHFLAHGLTPPLPR